MKARTLTNKLEQVSHPHSEHDSAKKSITILMVMADAILTAAILKITLVSGKAYVKRE